MRRRGRPQHGGRVDRYRGGRLVMTALGRRLLRYAPAIRGFVGLSAGIGVATALLVITQAGLLAEVIATAFLDGAGLADLAVPLVALVGVVLARAALGWGGEVAAQRAA